MTIFLGLTKKVKELKNEIPKIQKQEKEKLLTHVKQIEADKESHQNELKEKSETIKELTAHVESAKRQLNETVKLSEELEKVKSIVEKHFPTKLKEETDKDMATVLDEGLTNLAKREEVLLAKESMYKNQESMLKKRIEKLKNANGTALSDEQKKQVTNLQTNIHVSTKQYIFLKSCNMV